MLDHCFELCEISISSKAFGSELASPRGRHVTSVEIYHLVTTGFIVSFVSCRTIQELQNKFTVFPTFMYGYK